MLTHRSSRAAPISSAASRPSVKLQFSAGFAYYPRFEPVPRPQHLLPAKGQAAKRRGEAQGLWWEARHTATAPRCLPRPAPLPPGGAQRVRVCSSLPSHSGSFIASTLWHPCAGVLNQKDPLVCSATPHFSAHSSFMILMRVFFQETHISLFDLGASVRIFFNTTLAFWKC